MLNPHAFLSSRNSINSINTTTSSSLPRSPTSTARASHRSNSSNSNPALAIPLRPHPPSPPGTGRLHPSLGTTASTTKAPALESRHASSPTRKHDTTAALRIPTANPNFRTRNSASSLAGIDASVSMGKRKDVSSRLTPPNSPPSVGMSDTVARPNTASSAVEIPSSSKVDTAHKQHKSRHYAESHRRQHGSHTRRARDVHSSDAVSPSMAALLAITSIPPPSRRTASRQKSVKPPGLVRMTVDSIVPRSQISEKELSRELDDAANPPLLFSSYGGFSRSPLDILLSPPEDLEEDVVSIASDGAFTPPFSTRAASFDSIPSLGESLSTSGLPSLDSPLTPRGRRFRQPRRSLEPVVSPVGEESDHPLSKQNISVEFSFGVFDPSPVSLQKEEPSPQSALKSVFKSNLTASLRALRSAARSLSNFTASSIPPEDFLTRSILTIDPRVPFTDERMPPVLDQEPSEAMRRYLNPTTTARPEVRSATSVRNYTASIQMQTYKVQRSKNGGSGSGKNTSAQNSSKTSPALVSLPGPRQREVRENSDFIRIAVLEHLMRKNGKFDEQREGHARWVLPARKMSSKPYEIGSNGVPVRWVPLSQEGSLS
ncbi:hypothetical protein MN608_01941 [Microdochium nivale]|nr:hypothetical protein MN608_01941 [Microdochium nivale]